MSAAEDFRAAIAAAGIEPPDKIEADGRLHRFAPNGKRGDDAGWYVLHGDGVPAGAFGDWRTGESHSWRATLERKFTAAEEKAHRERVRAMQEQRAADEKQRHAEARERAASIWKSATPIGDHLYLKSKGVKAHGARHHQGQVVIPMRDAAGELHSLQFISPEGEKKFLTSGRVAGCYFAIGKPDGVLCIAEGFATGASIHEATGHAVAVAFNAGNLEQVARALREKYPDARIVLAADNDASGVGQKKAAEAAEAIGGAVAIPREAGSDWNDVHRKDGADAVKHGIDDDARTTPEHHVAPDVANAQRRGTASGESEREKWPERLSDAAFQGMAGEIVRLVSPHTEADDAALLLQILVAFGAQVGRGPHVRVEGDEHHCNLFCILVGDTSKARKGTAWGRVREVFGADALPAVVSGLSSGEGLKWRVRDRIVKMERDKKTGFLQEVETDPGVLDKRVLVLEPEFAQVLRQGMRAGNTLSATLRCGWDTGNLETLTKNDPVKATGAHIAIIGHITADELRAELTATDSANGFANRFLFTCVQRSKTLPFGGEPMDQNFRSDISAHLARAVTQARTRGAVGMDAGARDLWVHVYPALSEGMPGLFGAVTARAEAQCIRLALLYALLDCASAINERHLSAALAVWERAAASARYIFGSALGDPVADEILRALRTAGAAGVTRTEISHLFKRHQTAERIGAALDLLARRKLAASEKRATGGAPVEVWKAS